MDSGFGHLRCDVCIRCVLHDFVSLFFESLNVFSTVASSIMLTQWRTRLRRQMNERDVVRIRQI